MSRNSLGPWALEPGPSTPVMRNWALGNLTPSMFMNGMVPPSPIHAASLPNACLEAASTALASQGAVSGAFQPLAAASISKCTRAP